MNLDSKDDVFIHPTAIVDTDRIGPGTKIWAFVHVMKGAVIGAGCNICDHSYVEGGVTIGNDVVVKNGVSIWEGVTLEDGVFVGPNVAFTNDRNPIAKVYRNEYDNILVKKGASIGANATLIGPVTIGTCALVGAGSVVTGDVPDYAVVYGNPAKVKGKNDRR